MKVYNYKHRNFDVIASLLVLAAILVLAAADAFGQTAITRSCPGASPSPARSRVDLERDGDVQITACNGRSIFVGSTASTALIGSLNGLTAATQTFAAPTANDTASWSSVTSTHTLRLPITAISGSSRTNYFPYFNAANTLAKSPFSWDGTSYLWQNAAATSNFTSTLTTSAAGAGRFQVGDFVNSDNYLDISDGTGNSDLHASGTLTLGLNIDFGGVGTTTLRFASTAVSPSYILSRTITAAGTTGNRTINQPAGTVNIAAGAGAAGITVTNGTVTTSSIVFAVIRTADATCTGIASVVPAAGSVAIRTNANCTAETSIGFLVTN